MNRVLYVRVAAAAAAMAATFFRCGQLFTQDWQRVEVDAATAQRLQGEQALEVSEDVPAGFEPAPAEPVAAEPVATASGPTSTDPWAGD